MSDVIPNERLLGAGSRQFHPEVFLRTAPQLTTDESNCAERRRISPAEAGGWTPIPGQLLSDAGLPERHKRSCPDDLRLVSRQPHHLDVPLHRLIEGHARGEYRDE